jgi:hypothetical protein
MWEGIDLIFTIIGVPVTIYFFWKHIKDQGA